MLLEQWQAQGIDHLARKPVVMFDSKGTSQPPLLPTRQPKCPQPLLAVHAFQPCWQLCCPLNAFKYFTILFMLWKPELQAVLKAAQVLNIAEECLLWLAGYAVFNAPQDAACSSGVQGTLILSCCHQHLQVLLCWSLHPLVSQSAPVSSITLSQVQHPALLLLNFMLLMVVQCSNAVGSLIKMLDRIYSKIKRYGILLVTGHQWGVAPFTVTPGVLILTQFITQQNTNLCYLADKRFIPKNAVSFQHRKDMELLERIQRFRGLDILSYEDRLKELDFFNLEKWRPWGDLITAFQYLKGDYIQKGSELFTQVESDRTSGNGFKLKERRLRIDVGEVFHWDGGEVMEQVAQRGCGCPIVGELLGHGMNWWLSALWSGVVGPVLPT